MAESHSDFFVRELTDALSTLRDGNVHAMRHTFTTRALGGPPVEVVSQILGHSCPILWSGPLRAVYFFEMSDPFTECTEYTQLPEIGGMEVSAVRPVHIQQLMQRVSDKSESLQISRSAVRILPGAPYKTRTVKPFLMV